jgi:competence protein ComEA
MPDASPTPPTRRQALIARGEQLVLAVLALALVAGVAWRGISYYRLGAQPMEVIPAAPPTYRVDVNTADWVTLAVVPGLGEALSKRIIDLRDQRGGLKSLEELKGVRGISDKMLAKLRPYLFIGDGARAGSEPIQMVDRPPPAAAQEQTGDARNHPAGN